MATLIELEEPRRERAGDGGFALWEMGFRPFYLLASAYAAVSIALWAAQFAGWLPFAYLQGPSWHAHEMLFGFVLAVIVGFLLTAGRTWTGRPTLEGRPLMSLALLWLAARVLVLTPWGGSAALVNAAFPLLAAIALAVPFVRAATRRNYVFPALLVLLAAASLALHGARLGILSVPERFGAQFALDVVLFILVVMAGRVIPPFTANGVSGTKPRRLPGLERLSLGLVLLVAIGDAVPVTGTTMAWLLGTATLAHACRLALWQPLATRGVPLVWVLQLAYAWIVLHLGLRTLTEIAWIDGSTAVHALSVGAVGTMTLGMMTRTAKGHTGRALSADRADVTCYALVQGAAIVRVFGPLVAPMLLMPSVLGSALLWSAAFALYAVRYWPALTRARVDGRPG